MEIERQFNEGNAGPPVTGGAPPDGSVTAAKLATFNTPADDLVLSWDADNNRLYWKVDKDTTYTIPTELPPTDGSVTEAKLAAHNSPSTGQVLAWDTTNGLYWKDDADSGFSIGGTQASGKYIRATSATEQEWTDFPTIPTIPSTLPPTDDSVDNDSFANDLVIASKHIPTISYSDLSDRPTIPTALPPTDDSVGEAAINATDTPANGEFLQVSISSGVRTLNWASALTSIAAGSIGEGQLDIHNNPSAGKVLGYTSNGLEWVDDADTTPTLQSLVNGTPTDGQVVSWDNANTRATWADSGGGGGAPTETEIYTSTNGITAQNSDILTARSLITGHSFSDFYAIYFLYSNSGTGDFARRTSQPYHLSNFADYPFSLPYGQFSSHSAGLVTRVSDTQFGFRGTTTLRLFKIIGLS